MTDRTRKTAARRECDIPEIGPPAGLVAWHLDLGYGQELALFEFATSDGCPRATGVTAAERVVLGLAVTGLSNAEIAARRGVSPRTVANQMESLFRKLGVHSRLELQAWLAGVHGQ
jgi:DNA-binding CsgD family transcriptional regulator